MGAGAVRRFFKDEAQAEVIIFLKDILSAMNIIRLQVSYRIPRGNLLDKLPLHVYDKI